MSRFANCRHFIALLSQAPAFLALCLLLVSSSLLGCVHEGEACGRAHVSTSLATRIGYDVGPQGCPGDIFLPNGASVSDGLDEDEAVLIALWNNALFQELLVDLGVAEGDLIQAGLLPNPEVAYFFPVSDKPYKYAFDLPLEALWLRPIKVAAAERESARVCERLTQSALDLIRDTRQAYANTLLAQERVRIAEQAVRIRQGIADQAKARLDAGDASVQESATAGIDARAAEQDIARLRYDVQLAEERLRFLLGLGPDRTPLLLNPQMRAPLLQFDADSLAEEAASSRPDALSAAQNVAAADERLRLSRIGWVRFLGILDATSGQDTGHEFGPAFRATLPIFNWNQGTIARSEAELERAMRQCTTVENQIRLDVHLAHARYEQARNELQILQTKVLPDVDAAIRRSEAAYREGESPYVVVLQTTRQFLDSRNREEQLKTDIRLAYAELERSVGRRLDINADESDTTKDLEDRGP